MIEKRITEPFHCPQVLEDTMIVIADGADWDGNGLVINKEGTYVRNCGVKFEGTVAPGLWWRACAIRANHVRLDDFVAFGLNNTDRVHQTNIHAQDVEHLWMHNVRAYRNSQHFSLWFDGVRHCFMDRIKVKYAVMDGFKVDSKTALSSNILGYRCKFDQNGYQWGKAVGTVDGKRRWFRHFNGEQFYFNSDGMDWAMCRDSKLVRSRARGNHDGGLNIKDTGGQNTRNDNNVLLECDAYENGGNGIAMAHLKEHNRFERCRSWNNRNGVYVRAQGSFADITAWGNTNADLSIDHASKENQFVINEEAKITYHGSSKENNTVVHSREELVGILPA